jgi:hypothetical protein
VRPAESAQTGCLAGFPPACQATTRRGGGATLKAEPIAQADDLADHGDDRGVNPARAAFVAMSASVPTIVSSASVHR